MKSILFVSPSRLSQNLLQVVTAAARKKIDVACIDSLEEALQLSKKGEPFSLILVDWNCLMQVKNMEELISVWNQHRRLGPAKRILLHPRHVENPEAKFPPWSGCFGKPFLAQELINIILKYL